MRLPNKMSNPLQTLQSDPTELLLHLNEQLHEPCERFPVDAARLHEEVVLLKAELDQRTVVGARLEAMNAQLRDRLEQYQKQNLDNVTRAEQELAALQSDMQEALVQQTALEANLHCLAGRDQPTVYLANCFL